jgi:hypothetical protein
MARNASPLTAATSKIGVALDPVARNYPALVRADVARGTIRRKTHVLPRCTPADLIANWKGGGLVISDSSGQRGEVR